MTAVGKLEGADPTDLDGLHEALKLADPEGKLAPIDKSQVEIGPDALNLLPEVVSEVARGALRVALVMDATPMRRDGGDLKAEVERLLGRPFEVRRPVIGAGRAALHADEEALDETAAAVAGADCVVVGSGTNAFSDDMAVLLEAGTKRTVTSRWPDVLLIDIPCSPARPSP